MTTAYLNGDFVALEDARISPMDRGFLFGDGIYEVIPSYGGRMVGFTRHMQRLNQGLKAIELDNPLSEEEWQQLLLQLMEHNEGSFLGLYLQVTRGASMVRNHKFPADIPQTIFAYPFEVNAPCDGSPEQASCYRVATATDRRWRRCDIKSVALLGNVNMMEGVTGEPTRCCCSMNRMSLPRPRLVTPLSSSTTTSSPPWIGRNCPVSPATCWSTSR